jgi:hypothetical protein
MSKQPYIRCHSCITVPEQRISTLVNEAKRVLWDFGHSSVLHTPNDSELAAKLTSALKEIEAFKAQV